MATNPIDKELYSFSTEDGKAIPLDIIRPLAIMLQAVNAGSQTSITIPVTWKVASFYSSVGCFIEFASALMPWPILANTEYTDVLFVPPNIIVTATVIPGVAIISPASGSAGSIIIQQIQKWAGLALRRQASSI